MAKVRRVGDHWFFWCPACQLQHSFDRSGWFNGCLTRPTRRPAIFTQATGCHLFLSGGLLTYLRDCPHAMAGKTLELPEAS
jgi:hypothetical protein